MIPRELQARAMRAASRYPIVTITGPRQAGKTTLCRMAWPDKPYASLEAPDLRERARTDPRGFLDEFPDGAVLDEIQHVPDLASYLQVRVDENPAVGQFVLTGSQQFAISKTVSQSLAGRTAVLQLLPFELAELRQLGPVEDPWEVIRSGGFPRIHDRGLDPFEWLGDYVATYIERDVRQILNIGNLATFQTFVKIAAGRSAQLLQLTGLATDVGVDHKTAGAWVSVLEASYIATRLPPFFANVTKRLTKTPKFYFLDSGLLCYLLDIRSADQLRQHPLRGPIFETWVFSEILKARLHRRAAGELSFYRDRAGAEVDLLIPGEGAVTAVEVKSGKSLSTDAFKGFGVLEKVIDQAVGSQTVGERIVVYAGESRYRSKGVLALPWAELDSVDWTR